MLVHYRNEDVEIIFRSSSLFRLRFPRQLWEMALFARRARR
jgi:hypothetical protein